MSISFRPTPSPFVSAPRHAGLPPATPAPKAFAGDGPAVPRADDASALSQSAARFGETAPKLAGTASRAASAPKSLTGAHLAESYATLTPALRAYLKKHAETFRAGLEDPAANARAIDVLQRACAMNPRHFGTRYDLALFCAVRAARGWSVTAEQTRLIAEARDLLETEIGRRPGDARLKQAAFQLRYWSGDFRAAADHLQKLLSVQPDADVGVIALFEETSFRELGRLKPYDIGWSFYHRAIWNDGKAAGVSREDAATGADLLGALSFSLSRRAKLSPEEKRQLGVLVYLAGWCQIRAGRAERALGLVGHVRRYDAQLAGLLLEDCEKALRKPAPTPVPTDIPAAERAAAFGKLPADDQRRALVKMFCGFVEIACKPAVTTSDFAEFQRLVEASKNRDPKDIPLIQLLNDDAVLGLICFAAYEPAAFKKLLADSGFAEKAALFNVDGAVKGLENSAPQMRFALEQLEASNDPSLPPEERRLKKQKALASGIAAMFIAPLKGSIESADVAKVPAVQRLGDPDSGISGDTEMEKLLRQAIPMYYSNLPLEDKGRVVRAMLALPPDAPEEDAVIELLQASGPGMQKLFQLFGSKSESEKFRRVLDRLKDGIYPFPTAEARRLIAEDLGVPETDVFLAISEDPVAAASVSQVYYALRPTPQGLEKVALKIRRPEYLARVKREFEILERIITDDFGREVIRELSRTLTDEADFLIEAERTRLGAKDPRIPTARVAEGLPPTERFLATKWVEAPTLKRLPKLTEAQQVLLHQALANAYSAWLDRALVGDGFFQGDPHSGNVTYDIEDTGRAGLMDFGNSGQLTAEQQYGFAKLSAATFLKNSGWVLGALQSLNTSKTKLTPEQTKNIQKMIDKELSGDQPALMKMNLIVGNAVRLGMPLPKSLIELLRGMMLFDAEIGNARKAVEKQRDLGMVDQFSLSVNSIDALSVRIIVKKLGNSVPRGLRDISTSLGKAYLKLFGVELPE